MRAHMPSRVSLVISRCASPSLSCSRTKQRSTRTLKPVLAPENPHLPTARLTMRMTQHAAKTIEHDNIMPK